MAQAVIQGFERKLRVKSRADPFSQPSGRLSAVGMVQMGGCLMRAFAVPKPGGNHPKTGTQAPQSLSSGW